MTRTSTAAAAGGGGGMVLALVRQWSVVVARRGRIGLAGCCWHPSDWFNWLSVLLVLLGYFFSKKKIKNKILFI